MSKFSNEVKLTDEAWAEAIKTRDPMCRFNRPGCLKKSTDACHVFPRANMGTRFNLLNGIGGCRACHSWQETHPEEARPIMQHIVGMGIWMDLKVKATSIVKFYPQDLTKIRKDIKMYTKHLITQQ